MVLIYNSDIIGFDSEISGSMDDDDNYHMQHHK